jgi:hypothetical protein
MKTTKLTLGQKVSARLLKGGFNIRTVNEMMIENFEYVSSKYKGVSKISEVISAL